MGKHLDLNDVAAQSPLAKSELEELRKASERYETARLMNPRQWAAAWEENIKTGKSFDEIIDDMRPFMLPRSNYIED